MSGVSKLEFLGCAIAAAFAFGSACAKPCADVRLSPLSQGAMLYGDPVHLVDGKPFAKDPTVIRHGGRYLMYYSIRNYDKKHFRKGDLPVKRNSWWAPSPKAPTSSTGRASATSRSREAGSLPPPSRRA